MKVLCTSSLAALQTNRPLFFFHCLNIFKGVSCNNPEKSANYLRRAIVSSCWFNHVWTEQLLDFRIVWRHLLADSAVVSMDEVSWSWHTHTHTHRTDILYDIFSQQRLSPTRVTGHGEKTAWGGRWLVGSLTHTHAHTCTRARACLLTQWKLLSCFLFTLFGLLFSFSQLMRSLQLKQ